MDITEADVQLQKYKRIWMKTSEWDSLTKDESTVSTNWHGTIACAMQCSEQDDCSGFVHNDRNISVEY